MVVEGTMTQSGGVMVQVFKITKGVKEEITNVDSFEYAPPQEFEDTRIISTRNIVQK